MLAFSLFTNDAPADVDELDTAVRASVARLGPHDCAIWATISRPAVHGVSVPSRQLAPRTVGARPQLAGRLLVVPWAEEVARHRGWKAHDHVHATAAGYLARARLFADAARSCGPRPARPFGGSRCQPPAMAATIALRSRRAYTRPTARGACAASRSGANWESHAAAAGARAPGRERTAPASGRAARRRAAMPEAVDDTALLRPANTMRQVQRTNGRESDGRDRAAHQRANAFASSNLTCSPVTAEPAAMASAEPNPSR